MPPFEVRDAAFHDVVPPAAVLETVSEGHVFTEGPIWHPDEHWLVFSDIAASRQWRWTPDTAGGGRGETALFRCPSNQANGNAFDPRGRIVSCEHATSQVVRHEHGGKLVRPIATHHAGRELNSPNDLVVDALGRIYFTDPVYGRVRPDLGRVRAPELDHRGVYRLDPDGRLVLLADDFENPNGLCFSLDGERLFVNDSPRGHIRVFDLDEGRVSGGEVWAPVTGDGSRVAGSKDWVPDGMKTDLAGRIWCNGPGGVHLFAADARSLGVILMPEKSTNFCFGGPGLHDLFITASTRVYRLRTATTGLRMIPGSTA